jgi:hypothetical protein
MSRCHGPRFPLTRARPLRRHGEGVPKFERDIFFGNAKMSRYVTLSRIAT